MPEGGRAGDVRVGASGDGRACEGKRVVAVCVVSGAVGLVEGRVCAAVRDGGGGGGGGSGGEGGGAQEQRRAQHAVGGAAGGGGGAAAGEQHVSRRGARRPDAWGEQALGVCVRRGEGACAGGQHAAGRVEGVDVGCGGGGYNSCPTAAGCAAEGVAAGGRDAEGVARDIQGAGAVGHGRLWLCVCVRMCMCMCMCKCVFVRVCECACIDSYSGMPQCVCVRAFLCALPPLRGHSACELGPYKWVGACMRVCVQI